MRGRAAAIGAALEAPRAEVPTRPRLAYVITRAELGGAQVHVADLLEHFRERYELLLVCGDEGFLTDRARQLGVAYEVEPQLAREISPVADLRAAFRLAQLFRERHIALVHSHSSKAGVLGRLAALLARVPAIFTAHGWAFAVGVPALRRCFAVAVEAVFARMARTIIVVSAQDGSLARRFHVAGGGRMVVIRNGVADSPWTPRREDRSGGPLRILMVGRFVPQKDQRTLLEAVSGLPNAFTVRFVGDGPELGLAHELAARQGIADRVEFVGATTDVEAHLAWADLFVLATKWEGLPLVVLEAMRHGLPVVASEVGGIPEAIEDGSTGVLVPPGDPAALRVALSRLAGDPELRAALGVAGRRRYETHFRRDRMLREVERVYGGVLGAEVVSLLRVGGDDLASGPGEIA